MPSPNRQEKNHEREEKEKKQAIKTLDRFIRTKEWLNILWIIKTNGDRILVHSFDDTCDTYDAIYLTGDGFINHRQQPITDVEEIITGFVIGNFYGGGAEDKTSPNRRPSDFIPWIKRQIDWPV